MLKSLNQAIRFEAFFTANKQGKTGITVTVDVYKNSTLVVSGAAATEIGGGFYTYTLASGSVDASGTYKALFKTSDTTVDQQHMPAMWDVGESWVSYIDSAISGIPASVWNNATRTLTSWGTLVADIWSNATRSLTDKVGFSLATAPPTVSEIAAGILATPANKLLTNASGWVTVNVLSAAAIQSIWDALTTAFTTPGSVGYKFAAFLGGLGSDNRPKGSADAHTSGATIAGVTGGVTLAGGAVPTVEQNAQAVVTALEETIGQVDYIYGKFDQTPAGPVALVPAAPSGPIPLATVAFDATAFGIAQPGVTISYEMVETKTIMVADRFQIPRAVQATTDEEGRALVYLYPSSQLSAGNYATTYRVNCPEAKINALIEVPDAGALLADLL